MKIFHRIEEKNCIISVIGDLALTEPNEVRVYVNPFIKKTEIQTIILNCKNVNIIDSRGIGLIAALLKDLEEIQKQLILCHLNENCYNVLKTLKLNQLVKIYKSEEEAISNI